MRIGSLLLTLGVLLALAGCAPAASPPPSSSTPSATPVFASDAEALKAAETAYAAYQAAVDQSLQTGDPSKLNEVAVEKALATAKGAVEKFHEAGRRQVGLSSIDSVSAADMSPFTNGAYRDSVAQIYACLDVSKVDVVDQSGRSVSTPGRVTRYPTLVSLKWSERVQRILVSEESVWNGKNFCS